METKCDWNMKRVALFCLQVALIFGGESNHSGMAIFDWGYTVSDSEKDLTVWVGVIIIHTVSNYRDIFQRIMIWSVIYDGCDLKYAVIQMFGQNTRCSSLYCLYSMLTWIRKRCIHNWFRIQYDISWSFRQQFEMNFAKERTVLWSQ